MTIMTLSPATASENWQVDGGLGGQEFLGEDEHGDHRHPGDTHDAERHQSQALLLRQPVNGPGEPKHHRLLHPFRRICTVGPFSHRIRAAPPGRRSIVTSSPNQAPSPSAMVSAVHTVCGG